MLRIEALVKDYGSQRVLDGASLSLRPGDRAALVGANGAGKSTLLRIVAGLEQPDAGRVVRTPPLNTVGYLPQDPGIDPARSVHDEALTGAADLLRLEEEMRALEARIDAEALTPDELDTVVHRHADLQEAFHRRGGYEVEAELGRVLAGLGFTQEDHDRLGGELSGGWQMRVALARLLLAKPDVLLLDEPTNHLDLEAVEWLEGYLRSSRATVLLVSHDRAFMDNVVERVFDLRGGQVEAFVGNYTRYRAERELRDAQLAQTAERQQGEAERLEGYIRRYRAGNRAAQARSREKMLARVEAEQVQAPRAERTIHFRFPAAPPSGREAVSLKHVVRAFGEHLVLDDVTLTIERGQRVALMGPNGAGKSTLLRTMAGRARPERGTATLGVGVRLAYFAQDQTEHLDPSRTVLEEVYSAAPASWDIQAVRDLLGRLRFTGDEQLKPVRGLSGGERSRVALAKLLVRPSNLLLLDEPTNHLDVATRERLEETLATYPGTLVVATHDRYLARRLAERVVDVRDGRARVYEGGFDAYHRAREAETSAPLEPPRPEAEPTASTAPAEREAAAPGPARPAGREQRRQAAALRELEQRVAEAEEQLRSVEAQLSAPEPSADLVGLARAHQELSDQVAELTDRWGELAETVER